jgi:sterol desaturase/sphingolipid hydroxylase (fatty acid hydroxylase superfamily)
MTRDLLLRLGLGVGLLVLLALVELALPWRRPRLSRPRRWGHNLGLALVDVGVSKLVLPLGLVGVAIFAAERGWGILPALGAPPLLAGIVSFLALDLAVYLQHRVFHAVPLLWRFHGIHHADGELDVTTGDRFHPVEVAISLGTQSAVVALLGAPPTAALVFQLVLNAGSLFTHANLDLPRRLDGALRTLFVTPAVHRVHHSAAPGEADHNFGFNVLVWDRIFGTYRPAPEAGEAGLRIGIDGLTRGDRETLGWVVFSPFRKRRPPPGDS